MNVSVITGSWDYEGGHILGVFKDENKAKKIQTKLKKLDTYDSVEVNNVEIDKLLEGEEKINV